MVNSAAAGGDPSSGQDGVTTGNGLRDGGTATIRLLVYTRFSWLTGGFLVGLGILPWCLPTPTITAVYIQESPTRIATLTCLSFLASAMVIMTFRTTVFNAAARFADPSMERFTKEATGWIERARQCSWLLVGLVVPLSSLLLTLGETRAHEMAHPWQFFLAAIGGVLAAFALLALLAYLHSALVTPDIHGPRFFPFDFRRRRSSRGGRPEAGRADDEVDVPKPLAKASLAAGQSMARGMIAMGLRDGYVASVMVRTDGESEPRRETLPTVGHGPLILFTLVLLNLQLLILAFGPWMFRNLGWLPTDTSPFGALFFLVGLLMVLIGVLPGLSFYLDRYRIPTSWVFLLALLLLVIAGWAFPGLIVDHAYSVAPQPRYVEASSNPNLSGVGREEVISADFLEKPISLDDVVQGWAIRQKQQAKVGEEPNRTFVVVTAAGGGIQASGWTATVLGGLAENDRLRPLVGGIGIISAVSGGSVGTIYFLTRYPELMDAIRDDDKEHRKSLLGDVLDQSTRSSLEAVGWGLLFPDLWRNVGLVRSPQYDRGWVQEQVWADRMNLHRFRAPESSYHVSNWERHDWRIGHLAYRVKSGELPAVVFNCFSTTTGQRVWVAPFLDRNADDKRFPHNYAEFVGALGMQLRLSTAARISASFPYVSPTVIAHARNPGSMGSDVRLTREILINSHLADGGYTDNEGLLTALDLIRRLDQYFDANRDDCPFDRVLLLRIAPFPAPKLVGEDFLAGGSGAAVKKDPAYLQGLAGPALGLYRGRTVTQLERGDLEIEFFENIFEIRDQWMSSPELPHDGASERPSRLARAEGATPQLMLKQNPNTRRFEFSKAPEVAEREAARSVTEAAQPERYLKFDHMLIDFRLEQNGMHIEPPLSWKLNHQQKANLRKAWCRWQKDARLADLGDAEPVTSFDEEPLIGNIEATHMSPVRANLPTHDSENAKNVITLERKFLGETLRKGLD